MSKTRYEGLLVLNIKGKEDGAQKIIDRLEKEFTTEGAAIESIQKMDSRHFSYVKGKLDTGFYVNFVFTAEGSAIDRIRTKFKLDEDVYRQQYAKLPAPKKAA
jgi:small subunit ribosomal protein S6